MKVTDWVCKIHITQSFQTFLKPFENFLNAFVSNMSIKLANIQQTYLLLFSRKASFITSKLVQNAITLEHKRKTKHNKHEM